LEAKVAAQEAATAAGASGQAEELTRLRKENEDLLRLRNEVNQLRDERKKLTAQVQAAETRAETAQTQAQQVQAQVQAMQVTAAQQAAAAAAARPAAMPPALAAGACINNLRQIDGAKQQWALENRKTAEAQPTAQDLAPYLKSGIPQCPSGGAYTVGAVGHVPTCNQTGHSLPQ
jgi:hypothetical protein